MASSLSSSSRTAPSSQVFAYLSDDCYDVQSQKFNLHRIVAVYTTKTRQGNNVGSGRPKQVSDFKSWSKYKELCKALVKEGRSAEFIGQDSGPPMTGVPRTHQTQSLRVTTLLLSFLYGEAFVSDLLQEYINVCILLDAATADLSALQLSQVIILLSYIWIQ